MDQHCGTVDVASGHFGHICSMDQHCGTVDVRVGVVYETIDFLLEKILCWICVSSDSNR